MSLAQRLATPPTPKPSQTVMDAWFNGLSEEDRKAVLAAAHDTTWRHTDLRRELVAEGAPKIADTTFGVWRKRITDESH